MLQNYASISNKEKRDEIRTDELNNCIKKIHEQRYDKAYEVQKIIEDYLRYDSRNGENGVINGLSDFLSYARNKIGQVGYNSNFMNGAIDDTMYELKRIIDDLDNDYATRDILDDIGMMISAKVLAQMESAQIAVNASSNRRAKLQEELKADNSISKEEKNGEMVRLNSSEDNRSEDLIMDSLNNIKLRGRPTTSKIENARIADLAVEGLINYLVKLRIRVTDNLYQGEAIGQHIDELIARVKRPNYMETLADKLDEKDIEINKSIANDYLRTEDEIYRLQTGSRSKPSGEKSITELLRGLGIDISPIEYKTFDNKQNIEKANLTKENNDNNKNKPLGWDIELV